MSLAPRKSESWRAGTRDWLEHYVFPAMGDVPLSDFEPADVLALATRVAVKYPEYSWRSM